MEPVYLGDVSIHVSEDRYAIVDIKGRKKDLPHFTVKEATLLRALFNRPGKVCTPAMLASELYPGKSARDLPDQDIIKILISNIRKKLRTHRLPDPIVNVWGRGYRFGEPAKEVLSDYIPENLQNIRRWGILRKEEILALITDSESLEAVLSAYTDITMEELVEWGRLYQHNGHLSLRSSKAWLYV